MSCSECSRDDAIICSMLLLAKAAPEATAWEATMQARAGPLALLSARAEPEELAVLGGG